VTYNIRYKQSVEKDISALPSSVRQAVLCAIETRLATHPVEYGKPLRLSLKGHRRIRVGDYRIIYRVDESDKTVYVTAIGHRKDVYDQ
jgi:addiction module RelE/StbE family toxin